MTGMQYTLKSDDSGLLIHSIPTCLVNKNIAEVDQLEIVDILMVRFLG